MDYKYMYIICHHAVITTYTWLIKLQFPLFLATVLTNELTILFLQYNYYTHKDVVATCKYVTTTKCAYLEGIN